MDGVGNETALFGGPVGDIGTQFKDVGRWDGVTLSRQAPGPYEDFSQADVPFGAASFFRVPWRSYMGTVAASDFVDHLGMVFTSYPEEMEATFKLMSQAGIKRSRVEIAWGNFTYADETKMIPIKQTVLSTTLGLFRKYEIRPLILLNANHTEPNPFNIVTVQVTQPILKGDRLCYIALADLSKIIVNFAGFDQVGNDIGCFPIITAVNTTTGQCTLSAPIGASVVAGAVNLKILKYRPIGPDKNMDGTINLDTQATLNGWKTYVKTVTGIVSGIMGTPNNAGFDLEVWNEYTFGSAFINLNNYYNQELLVPTPRNTFPFASSDPNAKNYGWEVLLPITADYVKNQAKLPKTKVINGFSNQRPSDNGQGMGLEDGFSRHYYNGYSADKFYIPNSLVLNNPTNGGATPPYFSRLFLDAQGKRDGSVAANGTTQLGTLFVPAHIESCPERWFFVYQTESVERDLFPFRQGDDESHFKYSTPGDGRATEVWITETNVWRYNILNEIAINTGRDFINDLDIRNLSDNLAAKILVRHYGFYAHKGIKALYVYSTHEDNPQFGHFSRTFYEALKNNDYVLTPEIENLVGPSIKSVKNMYNIMKDYTDIESPRQLKVDKIIEYNPRWVFRGDGTAAHPDRYHGDDLAVLPYQMKHNKFAIMYYVVTRDVRHSWDASKPLLDYARYKMPDQDFDITLSNINGIGATVSSYDPILDQYLNLVVVNSTSTTITVKVKTVDYPRILVIEETNIGPLFVKPTLVKTPTSGALTFVPNLSGNIEVTWGASLARRPSLFTEKRYSDQNWSTLVDTRTIQYISYLNNSNFTEPTFILPTTGLSIEWTGQFIPDHTGSFHIMFPTSNDERSKLYIDGVLVTSLTTGNSVNFQLVVGQTYNLRAIYSTPYASHSAQLLFYSDTEPTSLMPGVNAKNNKLTAAVTANTKARIAIDGLQVGEGVSVKFTPTGLPVVLQYPQWVADVNARMVSVTPLETAVPIDSTVPTDIILTGPATINQTLGLNAVVGTLAAVDTGTGETFSFSLVVGVGDTNNGLFHIYDNELRLNDATNMASGLYSVRVQVSDGTNTFQKSFTTTIVDTTPPVFRQGKLRVTGITKTGCNLVFMMNEPCTVNYVLIPKGDVGPSVSQIMAGKDPSNLAPVLSGTYNVTLGNKDNTIILSGLQIYTAYDIYLAAQDKEVTPNIQTVPSKVSFYTSSNSVVTKGGNNKNNRNENRFNSRFRSTSGTSVPPPALAETLIARDTFNRDDTAAGLGVMTSGQTWVNLMGEMKIVSGKAIGASNADNGYYVDVATANCTVSVTLSSLSVNSMKLYLRIADGGNFLAVYIQSGTIALIRRQGVDTVIGTINRKVSDGDVITAKLNGNLVNIYHSGIQVLSVTETTFNLNTKFGIGSYRADVKISNFKVK